MANVIFWDVDTQHDFMVPGGKLYIREAETLAPYLKQLTEHARRKDLIIVATVCDHTMDDDEISENPDYEKTFPPHCLRNTPGQRKIPATSMRKPVVIDSVPRSSEDVARLVDDHDGEILVEKQHFDVFSNPSTAAVVDALAPDHVVLYGVALDVCDRLAIEGFLRRGGVTVHLVTDAVRAIHPEKVNVLLSDWHRQGVRMVTTREIVEGDYLDRLS